MSKFSSAKMMLRNLFSSPATRMYPARARTYYARTRGSIHNRIDECIFCGFCMRKCPTHALEVKKADREWSINRFACIACGACVEACPKKCLDMKNTYTPPATGKSIDHYFRKEPATPAAPAAPAAAQNPAPVQAPMAQAAPAAAAAPAQNPAPVRAPAKAQTPVPPKSEAHA